MMIASSRLYRPWGSRSGTSIAIGALLFVRMCCWAFVLVPSPLHPDAPVVLTPLLARWQQPQVHGTNRGRRMSSLTPRLFHTYLEATEKKKCGTRTAATSNSRNTQQPTALKAKKQTKKAPSTVQKNDNPAKRKAATSKKRSSTTTRKTKARGKTTAASAKRRGDKMKHNTDKQSTRPAKDDNHKVKAATAKTKNQNDKEEDYHASNWVDDDDVQEILNSVSDAQALLACRAYLVKRRQWTTKTDDDTTGTQDDGKGWTEWKRRQAAQQQTAEDESTGVFWEDLSQLQYWNPLANPLRWQQEGESNALNSTSTGSEQNTLLKLGLGENADQDDMSDIARHSTDTDASTALVGEDAFVSLAAWNEAYQEQDEGSDAIDSSLTLEDTEPSPEYLRRSEARRKKFRDEEWKAYWYQRRWGNRRRPSRRIAEERLHQRLSALWQSSSQAQVLAPVAEMSQEEMTQAIVEYVLANRKRSESQLAWREEQMQTRKQRQRQISSMYDSETERLPRDSLLQVNRTVLEEKQKARAERARKAYQARLDRMKKEGKPLSKAKQSHINPRRRMEVEYIQDGLSPKDALQRIEVALNEGMTPSLPLVERAMEPSRLSRRKEILLRLLAECFDLRGKQWHDRSEEDRRRNDEPTFLQHRSVSELGELCVSLLSKSEDS